MTPADYRTALTILGLSQIAAGRWLGVSKATAQRYATKGPSATAAKLIGYALKYGVQTDAELEPMTEQELVAVLRQSTP